MVLVLFAVKICVWITTFNSSFFFFLFWLKYPPYFDLMAVVFLLDICHIISCNAVAAQRCVKLFCLKYAFWVKGAVITVLPHCCVAWGNEAALITAWRSSELFLFYFILNPEWVKVPACLILLLLLLWVEISAGYLRYKGISSHYVLALVTERTVITDLQVVAEHHCT